MLMVWLEGFFKKIFLYFANDRGGEVVLSRCFKSCTIRYIKPLIILIFYSFSYEVHRRVACHEIVDMLRKTC